MFRDLRSHFLAIRKLLLWGQEATKADAFNKVRSLPFSRLDGARRRVCEIRLRVERKAGQLRSARENPSRGTSGFGRKDLSDMGTFKDQSSRWQPLADVPEDQFESLVAPKKPSTTGIIEA